jgi:hypothetical protein
VRWWRFETRRAEIGQTLSATNSGSCRALFVATSMVSILSLHVPCGTSCCYNIVYAVLVQFSPCKASYVHVLSVVGVFICCCDAQCRGPAIRQAPLWQQHNFLADAFFCLDTKVNYTMFKVTDVQQRVVRCCEEGRRLKKLMAHLGGIVRDHQGGASRQDHKRPIGCIDRMKAAWPWRQSAEVGP